MQYDLEERTMKFSKSIIQLAKHCRGNDIVAHIILQLVRAATSVGANYREANGASSKNDFRNKIYICRKEIQEAEYWIVLLVEALPICKQEAMILYKEAHELSLIFNKISSTLRN